MSNSSTQIGSSEQGFRTEISFPLTVVFFLFSSVLSFLPTPPSPHLFLLIVLSPCHAASCYLDFEVFYLSHKPHLKTSVQYWWFLWSLDMFSRHVLLGNNQNLYIAFREAGESMQKARWEWTKSLNSSDWARRQRNVGFIMSRDAGCIPCFPAGSDWKSVTFSRRCFMAVHHQHWAAKAVHKMYRRKSS